MEPQNQFKKSKIILLLAWLEVILILCIVVGRLLPILFFGAWIGFEKALSFVQPLDVIVLFACLWAFLVIIFTKKKTMYTIARVAVIIFIFAISLVLIYPIYDN